MLQRLEEFGGSGQPVVFAHANGYPVGSYRQFIAELTRHVAVTGYQHRPLWSEEAAPVLLNWEQFSNDLVETLEATQQQPVWMMGHSMGAAVAVLAAERRPELFRGLLLIDPVFILPQQVEARSALQQSEMDQMPMIARTLTRPNRFDSHQAAFDFYRGKRAFTLFSDEVLWDYVRAGTRLNKAGELELAYGREWEAAAYRSSPLVWTALSRIKLPVLGLRGKTSDTLSEEGFQRWHRTQPHADLRQCQGGHLLPLEYPAATAAQVIDFLERQAPPGQT